MTGYALATAEHPRGALSLELKSVNSRFLDLQFRVAEELRALEPLLRETITARVTRGKLDCRLSFAPGAAGVQALDSVALETLRRIAGEAQRAFPQAGPLRLGDVLHWPGVLAGSALDAEELRAAVDALAKRVVDELCAARLREGAKLAAILSGRVGEMRARLAEVARTLAKGGAAGKRLDFLAQELNREANTLASKAATQRIADCALELKLLIEQIREQVQNIE